MYWITILLVLRLYMFRQPFCPSSGVLSRKSALENFMQLWWPFATRSGLELQFQPTPGSKRSSKLYKMYQSRCTTKNSWWWAEGLPEICTVVIPIKLEFNVSVGFINKTLKHLKHKIRQTSFRITAFASSKHITFPQQRPTV